MIVALSLVEIDMLFSFSSETEGRWGARAGGGGCGNENDVSSAFCRRHEEVVVVGGSLVLMVYVPAIGEDMAIISTSLS